MVKFAKRIIHPGTYTVKRKDGTASRVYVGKKRLENWVKQFRAMRKSGLQIPAPWRHNDKATPIRLDPDAGDIDAYNNAGFWDNLRVGKDGWLWGDVDVPRDEDASRVGTTVQDVSLLAKPKWLDGKANTYEDAITHIALVTHPVAKDDKTFEPVPEDALALSTSDLYFGEPPDEGEEATVDAAASTVKDALKMLAEISSVTLPDDTNAENFLERLVTALAAIRGTKDEEGSGDSLQEPPSNSKQQPGPVAMAKEIDIALSLLSGAKINDPKTNKPYTADAIKTLADAGANPTVTIKMSTEDQASVSWAQKQMLGTYRARIEKCVETGRVTPSVAKEFWDRMSSDTDLRFSFNEEGEPVKNQYDWVLASWETTPANGVLTNLSPTKAKATRARVFGKQAFSLAADLEEEDPDDETGFSDPMAPLTDEQADKVLALQFQASGKRDSDIEGGYSSLGVKS